MTDYMVLLYAPETDAEGEQARLADMPAWIAVTESLRNSGVLLSNNRLHATDTATTVRVRGGDTEVTDGPFAVTAETLVGYYLLRCASLDEALRHAARFPAAAYGSVEVRPVHDLSGAV
ncbi:YciI family protein [Nocardia sp. alder85J]|uniref:YciI family protein n=1 Tax=Nocardia sp. alder85J TaxID=2862949 RepID=UPI001CD6157B|nr:YciI family protein [Nocardia sp. alder85J]MCX4098444.1 YciI family protein [Nocardia sp. alder85J]